MAQINFVDLVQGIDDDGNEYGCAGIEGRGGQFFTWLETCAETLESIRDDVTDAPDEWPQEAYVNVRGLVRRNWARVMDRQKNARHMMGTTLKV